MGSPYSVSTVSRVSVVRSAKGLERVLLSIASYGGHKLACKRVVALAMEKLSNVVFWDNYVTPLSLKTSKEIFRNGMSEVFDYDEYDALFPVLIDVAEQYYFAFVGKTRSVVVVEPRYDWKGSEKFGLAIVIDLTKRTPLNKGDLSTGV